MSTAPSSTVDLSYRTAASSWNKLFDRYYRKVELYSMRWGAIDLGKMIVSAAQFAGPLGPIRLSKFFFSLGTTDFDQLLATAVLRDDKKMSLVTAGSLRPTLNIYGCSGILLASIPVIDRFPTDGAASPDVQVIFFSGSPAVSSRWAGVTTKP